MMWAVATEMSPTIKPRIGRTMRNAFSVGPRGCSWRPIRKRSLARRSFKNCHIERTSISWRSGLGLPRTDHSGQHAGKGHGLGQRVVGAAEGTRAVDPASGGAHPGRTGVNKTAIEELAVLGVAGLLGADPLGKLEIEIEGCVGDRASAFDVRHLPANTEIDLSRAVEGHVGPVLGEIARERKLRVTGDEAHVANDVVGVGVNG